MNEFRKPLGRTLLLTVIITSGAIGCVERTADSARGSTGMLSLADTLLVIGADDQLGGHALHQVRGAHRAADGRVFVADGGSSELRVFQPDGRLEATYSRKGRGPGEHQALAWLEVSEGDTVITYDGALRKLVYWCPSGGLAREIRLTPALGGLVDRLNSDLYVEASSEQGGRFAVGTSHTDTLILSFFAADNQLRTPVVRLPFQTRFAATLPQGGTIYTPLPLEPQAVYASGPAVLYVGYPSKWRIRRFHVDGTELAEIRLEQSRQALTPEAREAWKAPLVERMPDAQRPDMVRYLDALPYSDSLPAYDTFLVDDLEQLWVREFPVPGADSAVWRVFGEDGVLRGRIGLKPEQRLFHVGTDFAVVGDTRTDGIELVTVRTLRR